MMNKATSNNAMDTEHSKQMSTNTDLGQLIEDYQVLAECLQKLPEGKNQYLELLNAMLGEQRDLNQQQIRKLEYGLHQLKEALSSQMEKTDQLNKENSNLSTESKELRQQLVNANNKIQQQEFQLRSSEKKVVVATYKVTELNELNLRSTFDVVDTKEQLSLLKRVLKALELELVSTKTELKVKDQLLEMFGNQLKQSYGEKAVAPINVKRIIGTL